MEKEFFTVETLADYLSVSQKTVRNWVLHGQIKYVKLFGNVRFRKADIEALIKESTMESFK